MSLHERCQRAEAHIWTQERPKSLLRAARGSPAAQAPWHCAPPAGLRFIQQTRARLMWAPGEGGRGCLADATTLTSKLLTPSYHSGRGVMAQSLDSSP